MSELNVSSGRDTNIGEVIYGDKITNYAPPLALSLHQLPPPPCDFTGREAELKELLAAVEKGGVTISGLHGLGGMGKTALALVLRSGVRTTETLNAREGTESVRSV